MGTKKDQAQETEKAETAQQAALRKARAKRLADRARAPEVRYDQREKLRVCMALRGVTQSSLARITRELADQQAVPKEILQTRISKWLLGVGEPGHVDLYVLAKALRVPLAYLADPTRTEPPVLDRLERELELEKLIGRVGIDVALDRVSLRSTVEVIGSMPGEPERTYSEELARVRLRTEKHG